MSDAMDAEFDTVASWTADAAAELGPDHFVAAGCRGSGGPATFDLLLDALEVRDGAALLDVGAGVGGPAAYAQRSRGVRPVLVDPEAGACRAARRLFGLPTIRADGLVLPFADGAFDAVWSLGVLCTTPDHVTALTELRRVLADDGRLALLVYVAVDALPEQPDGNTFPADHELHRDIATARLSVLDERDMVLAADESDRWQEQVDAVECRLDRRHSDHPAWTTAQEQSAIIGRLLSGGQLRGRLLSLRSS
ncbi:MAG: class I SAM-dependent methyltransferase [Jatrophihabitans sp.]